ncbi:hypothetical protein H0H93_013517 [Arthromyces matolae]|nr:hypothetical protein H0H93_013517 [Arthromyces matolae]
MSPSSLSRTSSTASVDSSDDAAAAGATSLRRTRKRFTNDQLTLLENLFHKTSHPSREDRDLVATLGGMETKSVTIWFQNKRQMERKSALNNTIYASRSHSQPSLSATINTNRSSRPSLDSVASRTELPMPPPRTPSRKHDSRTAIWESMPSSPLSYPFSPPSREYVHFGKSHRSKVTLEWACAAARLSDKHASRPRRRSKVKVIEKGLDRHDLDEDTDEAITPPGTLAGGDVRWTTEPEGKTSAMQPGSEEDDMMKAALMLCDLGRRPS